MDEIKTLLLCCSRFALPAMQQLAYANQLGAVIIPAHAKEMIAETKQALGESAIPVIIADKKDFEELAIKAINEYALNIGMVLTFSFMIPRSVFEKPEKGFYNFHPGVLPEYRGADPIFHQIKNKEKFAGITVHKLEETADTGEIVFIEKIHLKVEDTYGVVSAKLAAIAAKLINTLTKIVSLGFTAPSKPQDETKAKYYPKQSLDELAINWQTMDAAAIIALMNACNPHNKGAATSLNKKLVHVIYAEKEIRINKQPIVPGTIIAIDDNDVEVAVINDQLLKIKFVYTAEGFLTPYSLLNQGVLKGMRFENIFLPEK